MKIKNPDDYKFLRFEKSNSKNKKYDAILFNKKTGKEKRVPFGDKRYQQYRDRTGLNLYSNLDHNDLNRRHLYLIRHAKDMEARFSSGFFAKNFLW